MYYSASFIFLTRSDQITQNVGLNLRNDSKISCEMNFCTNRVFALNFSFICKCTKPLESHFLLTYFLFSSNKSREKWNYLFHSVDRKLKSPEKNKRCKWINGNITKNATWIFSSVFFSFIWIMTVHTFFTFFSGSSCFSCFVDVHEHFAALSLLSRLKWNSPRINKFKSITTSKIENCHHFWSFKNYHPRHYEHRCVIVNTYY